MDYSANWGADEARLLAAHIARTVARLETLAGRYAELRGLVPAGSGGRPEPDGSRRGPAGPRVPVRVEVLDTLAEVDRYLSELLPLVRGTLRLGTGAGTWAAGPKDGPDGRAARARAGLKFLAAGLAGVYADDPVLGDAVARGAWTLERRAGWLFGDVSRPFALSDPCPACSVPALWVVPDRMVIVCGNPACRASRPVHAVLPVHTSGPDST